MSANLLRKISTKIPPNWVRRIGNLYLPYLGAGIRCTYVNSSFTELHVQMKLMWFNRNYVGTQFGGSLYAMTDPFYMLMLMNNLGQEYIVWDKAAKIDFIKPGRGAVYVKFILEPEKILEIKRQADQNPKYVFDLPVQIKDGDQNLIAEVVKTLYVKKKTNSSVSV